MALLRGIRPRALRACGRASSGRLQSNPCARGREGAHLTGIYFPSPASVCKFSQAAAVPPFVPLNELGGSDARRPLRRPPQAFTP